MEVTAVAATSVLATPIATAQQPAPTPISLPTATPVPLATAMPTAQPYLKLFRSDGRPVEGTLVAAAPQVACTPQGEVIGCYDALLEMDFRYPAFMGQLLYTELKKGGYAGYAYEYAFDVMGSAAGGRSRNFSEGRGYMYTDAKGFNGHSAEEICADRRAAMCQELGPGALLIVLLPQAEWLCSDAMMFHAIPRSILVLDLPEHPLINGFAFTFQLLSAQAEAAFRDEWYSDGKQCAPETKVELGSTIEQLRQDLEAGTAVAEIQQRYDAMIQIAESIQSPFFAANP